MIGHVNRPPERGLSDSGRGEIGAGIAVIVGFFGLFLGWAAFAPLDAAVVAQGTVTVAGNRQTLQHPDGGVISRLNVREGQLVKKGDVLIELAAPELNAQKTAILSEVLELQVQRQRILDEFNRARALTRPAEWANLPAEDRPAAAVAFERERKSRPRPTTVYAARIAGHGEQITALDRQEVLLKDELEGMRTLAEKQLVPLTRVRALERALADIDEQRASLRTQIAVARQDRTAELRAIEAKLATLAPQLAGAREKVEETRLRAPASGAVVGLTAFTLGGVIAPGARVLDIVPENPELVVQAQVRPDDADDLKPGMRAQVRITAFHDRVHPYLEGRVKTVSADRFVDEKSGMPYFTAIVTVPAEELRQFERLEPLSAGLPAEIMAPKRKRTALQYFLEPLNQALWRSFREG